MDDEDKVKLWLIAVICVLAVIAIGSGVGWIKSAGNYQRVNTELGIARSGIEQAEKQLTKATAAIYGLSDQLDRERKNYTELAEQYKRQRDINTKLIATNSDSLGITDSLTSIIKRSKDLVEELQKRNAE